MASANNGMPSPAPVQDLISDESGNNEKKQQITETTHYVLPKPSRDSVASNSLMVAAPHSRPHNASTTDLPRTSDISVPDSAAANPFETDIEAIISHTDASRENPLRKTATRLGATSGDCQVWPGKNHWKKKAREDRIKRSCTCLSRLSKRNRLIARIAIGLVIVGIAVGFGIGLSKALGARIWQPRTS